MTNEVTGQQQPLSWLRMQRFKMRWSSWNRFRLIGISRGAGVRRAGLHQLHPPAKYGLSRLSSTLRGSRWARSRSPPTCLAWVCGTLVMLLAAHGLAEVPGVVPSRAVHVTECQRSSKTDQYDQLVILITSWGSPTHRAAGTHRRPAGSGGAGAILLDGPGAEGRGDAGQARPSARVAGRVAPGLRGGRSVQPRAGPTRCRSGE